HVVDSFDTHAKIPEHFSAVNKNAKESGKIGVISCGWDPGMFSIQRVYAQAILPDGNDYTFWGKGVSQGHSDAIRRIEGVLDARQYTVPVENALEQVRSGSNPTLTTREKHTRECFVVAEEGADLERIEKEIKEMPNYFADYNTTVNFITSEELQKNHASLPHGGFVIRTGETSDGTKQKIEYSLKLDSNPEFTGSVLLACARAAIRLSSDGICGAKTILDLPPSYLSPISPEELRAHSV
ncbi:MAG: diaminopimelate dehydrogenase, partial [Clostridia bacterium]|nr:diaminopimelate dehydrogenase [Clostridia bacterium]